MQFVSDLMADLGSEDPLSLQMDPSDTQSRITLEPVNGAEPVFPETPTIFSHNLKRKSIHYSIPSLQSASLSKPGP